MIADVLVRSVRGTPIAALLMTLSNDCVGSRGHRHFDAGVRDRKQAERINLLAWLRLKQDGAR
jgi:hypothetical protein